MISKITELYIVWGEIQIPTEKDSLVLKLLQRWQNLTFFEGTLKFRLTEPHIFCWDIQTQLEKQFSTQMISKVTETYMVFGDTQIPIEKDSSVQKWSQRLQNFTSFEERFRPQLKKTV